MKVALLGFSQSGRKTFFTLLTGRKIPAGLKAGEALEGVAPIRDPRVDSLSALVKPEKTRYAENLIVLCPEVTAGAGKREWLETAKKCDLLCVVVRAFTSSEVYHPAGSVDPKRDRSNLESELLFADLELIEKRLERMAKEKRAGQTAQQALEERTLEKIKTFLEGEMRLAAPALEPHELESIRSLGLLCLKPVLWACNVDEGALREAGAAGAANEFTVSCRLEQEIMDLDKPEEREAYLKELGLSSSGLDRLNRTAYDALGLMSFYTIGEDEVRAWTIRKGSTGPTAAGKVHSDIERGFIRVEIIKYDDLVAAGSEAAVKAQGKSQVKGRDYVIQDGDICHFKFNV
ncbi:MAG: redox-regulated ATPase YchF [Lentisphaerae bacterium]|nr:redox-regulated ATPase YchF [Lentisphaerota bacterium]